MVASLVYLADMSGRVKHTEVRLSEPLSCGIIAGVRLSGPPSQEVDFGLEPPSSSKYDLKLTNLFLYIIKG